MTPRYLVPFRPKNVSHRFADLLVIGSGLAGLRAVREAHPNQTALLVTKDKLLESNSNYAQGGIAGVLGPEDDFQHHFNDTMAAGGNLCNPEIVDMVIRDGPRRIEELIAWGTRFDHDAGTLALGREGGHSHQRIVHAHGDATGREVMRAMIEHIRQSTQTEIWERAFTLDLLTHDGRCRGAVITQGGSQPTMVWAKQTILCTGGAGQVFRESTNPPVATGDGYALAYRAGAELRDMEFIQFHPTVLYIAGSSRSLITEAIRGEGAYLVDCNGDRFMPDYDPRAELAPRDIVSQSIIRQMAVTSHNCVYLDLAHLDREVVLRRFPGIAKTCEEFGLDLATDRIPVRPGAHYMVGGVSVDRSGHTSLPGLWAAGEVTSSGLHGANRLASNSLLEGLVFGALAGQGAARAAAEMPDVMTALPIESSPTRHRGQSLDLADVRASLKSVMGRLVGVQRDAAGLKEAVSSIDSLLAYVLPQQFDHEQGWETQNLLQAAWMMATSALAREESRGVHFRTDFPVANDLNWRRHLAVQIETAGGYPRPGQPLPEQSVQDPVGSY